MQQAYCFHHFFSENVTKRKNMIRFFCPFIAAKQPNSPTRLHLFVCKRKETK